MTKQWNFYDSGGVLRKVKTPYFYDSGGVLRTVKDGYFYDSAGVLRHFFSGAPATLCTFTPGALSVSGLTTPAVYGTGARTTIAGLNIQSGGGKPAGGTGTLNGNLVTPDNVDMPFGIHAAKLMMVGRSGTTFNPGSASGTYTAPWFYMAPEGTVYGTPFNRPNTNQVYLLVKFADYNIIQTGRTACFGTVDFGDGAGPRPATDAIFRQFGETLYFADYSNFGLWAFLVSGAPASLTFGGTPLDLQPWTWSQGGASRSVTPYYEVGGSWSALASTGTCYAPVGSEYYPAGTGGVSLAAGTVPAGLGIKAIHFSLTTSSALPRIFTDEATPWQTMPKMQLQNTRNTGTPVGNPKVLIHLGAWSMTNGGPAIGQVYSVTSPNGYTPVTTNLANLFNFT